MPSTVENLSPTRVKLTIDIPFADLQPVLDRVYQEVSQQVQIPGFRKGKVPARIIDQRFGRGAILQDAINDYLPTAFYQAITEHKLSPLGQPEIEIVNLEDGKEVKFTAELDIRPEFEVADPAKVSVSVSAVTPTDEQLDEQIEMLRERFATVTEVNRKAKADDQVVIDLTASADGKELTDVSATDMNYIVGANGFIEGLDEAVTGLKSGEEATFATKLVGGEYAGKEADVTVKVTKVQKRELPKVDDEFAQLVSQFDTVEDMRIDLSQNLEKMNRLRQAGEAKDKVLAEIVANTKFDLPEGMVDTEVAERKAAINKQLAEIGTTLERYLEETDQEVKTADEFYANLAKNAEEGLRAQIILDKLTEEATVEVSQNDLVELIYQKAMANGTSPEVELQHMMEHGHQEQWTQEVRRGKVLSELVSKAKITDADGNSVDLAKIGPDGAIVEAEPSQPAPSEKPAKKTKTATAKKETKTTKKADSKK